MKPKPWPELQGQLPPLTESEQQALRQSIKSQGVRVPILVMSDGRIIDGNHRWKFSQGSAKIEIAEDIKTDAAGIMLGLSLNLDRRQLSYEQSKEIREAQRRTVEDLRKQGLTQQEVSEKIGMPQQTISDWDASNTDVGNTCIDRRQKVTKQEKEDIVKASSEKTHAEIAAEYKISRQRVSQIIQQAEARKRKPDKAEEQDPPSGKYETIVIDPPWPVKKIEREERPKQGKVLDYPVMSLDEIRNLSIPAQENCHLWLWTTHKLLPEALSILAGWDFRYICCFVWHKNGGFQSFGLPQYNCEFALYGRKGSPKFKTTKAFPVCFSGKRGRHSEKPDDFYDMVRRVTTGKRLDMFARREIKGFSGWGSEA